MPKGPRKFSFAFEKSGLTRFGGLSLFQAFCRAFAIRHFLQLSVRWPDYDYRDYHPADTPVVGFCAFGEQGVADDGTSRHNNEVTTVLVLGQELACAARLARVNPCYQELLAPSTMELTYPAKLLRESREQYLNFFDGAQDGILVFDANSGITVDANAAAERLTGRLKQELVGLHFGQLISISPDQFNDVVSAGGAVTPLEAQVFNREQPVSVEVNVSVIEIRNGRRVVQAIARDVTERKRAEEAIRQSEEKYRSLLANIPDIAWTTDARGVPVFISSNCEVLSGYTPEEPCNSFRWLEMVHPEDAPRGMAAFAAFVAGGPNFDVETRTRKKNGEWIWVHSRAITSYVRDGERFIDGIHSDITRRKLAEEALLSSDERVRLLLDSTAEAIYGIDLEGLSGARDR